VASITTAGTCQHRSQSASASTPRLDDLFQGVGCRDEVRVSKIGL
jgi:hypothetical protein